MTLTVFGLMPSWCHFFPLVELWVKEMKSQISHVSERNKKSNLFIMCKPKRGAGGWGENPE